MTAIICDIARRARISPAAVSKTLLGADDTSRISKVTRPRGFAAVVTHAYAPDTRARDFFPRRTHAMSAALHTPPRFAARVAHMTVFLSLVAMAATPARARAPMGAAPESYQYVCVAFSGSIDLAELTRTNNYRISSATDLNYVTARMPLRVGRRSQLLEFPKYPDHALSNVCGQWAYLELPLALQSGHAYAVLVSNVNGVAATAAFHYDDATRRSRVIKINQVGYTPESATKYGYVGGYLGSLGALPLDFAKTAFVCNAATHVTALSVPISLRADSNKVYSDPTVYEWQLTGESVYQFDFSALTNVGRYYVRVPGLGRSPEFVINDDVYWHVFTNVAHAFYLQRCGIAMQPPYASIFTHGVCHTQAMPLTTSSNIDTFIKADTVLTNTLSVRGGYHDAGDYDRRLYHLEIARRMLDTYAMLSNRFTDGQLFLPDAGNGVPDILDEVAWGLRVWFELQDPHDGGIRGGTERLAEGGMTEPVDDPHLDYYVFGKDLVNSKGQKVPGSAWFAAAAAQFARAILPFDDAAAQRALESARRAYTFAQANGADISNAPAQRALGGTRWAHTFARANAATDAAMADAAAELYCTTGESAYHQDFLDSGVRQSFSYATCTLSDVDPTAKSACRSACITQAGDAASFVNAYNSYRCARHPYNPIRYGGGSGGHKYALDLCKGYALTRNSVYMQALQHDANFVLGCNPLGRSWITGIGDLTPELILHRQLLIEGRTNIPAGYHIYGPFAKSSESAWYGTHYEAFWTNLYPATMNYPSMRAYVASEWMAGMNEFTVAETLAPSYCAFAYAHLARLSAPPAPPDTLPPGILILAPTNGATVTDACVTVRARIADAGTLEVVQIQSQLVSGDLFYTRSVALDEGTNQLRIVARDTAGNAATATWHVVCTVPEPASTLLSFLTFASCRRRR